MATCTIKWHAVGDDRTCPVCHDINGYEWIFEGVPPDSLVHPKWGEVWNVQIGSLAHEHQFSTPKKGGRVSHSLKYGLLSNCRCHITTEKISAPDLLEALQKLRDELRGEIGVSETDEPRTGSRRSTTFEDIGVDPSKYGFE